MIRKLLFKFILLVSSFSSFAYEEVEIYKYLQGASIERKIIVEFIIDQFKPYKNKGINQKRIDEIFNDQEFKDEFFLSRFQIINQKLYADSHNITGDQFTLTYKYLQKLIKKYKINDVDFIVFTRDEIQQESKLKDKTLTFPAFMFSKDTSYLYEKDKLLIPDPFMLQTRWGNLLSQIDDSIEKFPWESKTEKIFWRGWPSIAHHKKGDEINLLDVFPRVALVMLSKLYPEKIDARFFIPEKDPLRKNSSEFVKLIDDLQGGKSEFVKEVDHLQYKYLISIDGSTCSWRRVPWILYSNSVLIKQETSKIEWFYPALERYKHYVPLKENIEDIIEKYTWLKENDNEAKEISENAHNFILSSLTPNDIDKQFVIILNEYSKIQQDSTLKASLYAEDEMMSFSNIIKLLIHKIYLKMKNSLN